MSRERYTSPLLRVNLAENKIQSEEIDRSLTLKFLGGRGVGCQILFDELKPSTEPLAPENKLLLLAGRGGAGAVMGSKNLKAIAVQGTRKVPVTEAQKFEELQRTQRISCNTKPTRREIWTERFE